MEKIKSAAPVFVWHFVGDNLRDSSPIPKDGEWLKFNGKLILCSQGLHASLDPFDALEYAPGATLCRVQVRGKIIYGTNKLVATERMIVCRMNATELLRYFARMQALSVAHMYDTPEVIIDYLMTGDEGLRGAARVSARGDTWSAARNSAWEAAGATSWEAAGAAALAAAAAGAGAAAAAAAGAGPASWAGAGGDARSAAWTAARDAARKDFTDLVHECFGVS